MHKCICKHCSHRVVAEDIRCAGCGIPLPPSHAKSSHKKFVIFFIGIVIFCVFMIIWLPPSWSSFLDK